MDLIFITSDRDQAKTVEYAGVDRIMIDLEKTGKIERQGHLNTLISDHDVSDISVLRSVIQNAELLVRTNPLSSNTAAEVCEIIDRGADRLMLPMFRSAEEVEEFVEIVKGRVPVTLLVETAAAFGRLPTILSVAGIDDVHLGLNDLHLDMGLDFMFELFSGELVDHFARTCRGRGIKFGIGGVAPIGTGMLPSELIVAEHARLNSNCVILSRGFRPKIDEGKESARIAVSAIRNAFAEKQTRTNAEIDRDRAEFNKKVAEIIGAS